MATTSRRTRSSAVDQGNRAAQHGSGIFDRLRGNDDLAAVLVLPEVVRAEDDGMHAGLSCGLDLVPDCPDCSKTPIGPDPPGPGKRATAIARAGERGRDGHARVEAPAFEQPAQADGQGDTQRAAADVRLAAHALQMPPHPAPANELVPDQRPSVDQAPAEVFVENHATERNRIGEETGGLIKCAAAALPPGSSRVNHSRCRRAARAGWSCLPAPKPPLSKRTLSETRQRHLPRRCSPANPSREFISQAWAMADAPCPLRGGRGPMPRADPARSTAAAAIPRA